MNLVEAVWMYAIASHEFLEEYTLGPLPPGTDVYASMSISMLDTKFSGNSGASDLMVG